MSDTPIDIRTLNVPLFHASADTASPAWHYCYGVTTDGDGFSTIHVARKNDFRELGRFTDWFSASAFLEKLEQSTETPPNTRRACFHGHAIK